MVEVIWTDVVEMWNLVFGDQNTEDVTISDLGFAYDLVLAYMLQKGIKAPYNFYKSWQLDTQV